MQWRSIYLTETTDITDPIKSSDILLIQSQCLTDRAESSDVQLIQLTAEMFNWTNCKWRHGSTENTDVIDPFENRCLVDIIDPTLNTDIQWI